MEPTHEGHESANPKITIPLCFIIFFSVLNGVMFNVAVPDIAADFRLLPSGVSWVMTSYIVVFAIGSLTYGKLADIYSVKKLITVGLVLLNAGALVGLFADLYPVLITARIVQAAGGAAIPALAMLVATKYMPPDIRGKVLGVIASTVALAMGIGPVLGGFISGTFHWKYLFLTNFVTIFTIPAFHRMLPREEKKRGSFDLAGAALLCGGVAALLFYITQGIWWFLPLSIALIIWFGFRTGRVAEPFIRPSLIRNRAFRMTVATTFLAIGSVFGMMFMIPIMLRELNGLDANFIGLSIFPGAMSAAMLGTVGGRLSDRKGSRYVAKLGMGILVMGYAILSTVSGSTPLVVSLALIVSYMGFAFLQSSLPHTASLALPHQDAGVGMGIYNLFFFVSGAFMAAGTGRLLDTETAGFCLNPLCVSSDAWIFSNLFLLLAAVIIIAAALFSLTPKTNHNT